jgi:hypothetical protein
VAFIKSDVELIWDVLVHYCYLVDCARFSEIPEAIFTEDATDDHGFGPVRGRGALREMLVGASAVYAATSACNAADNICLA